MLFRAITLSASIIFLFAQKAFALQVHPAPEGLYAHQIAHLFYLTSMLLFIYWIRKSKLSSQKAWRYIQYGCLLLALWNVWAFVGHIIEHSLPSNFFMGQGWNKTLVASEATAGYFYILLKMDHLICVPAVAMLFIALRQIKKKVQGET